MVAMWRFCFYPSSSVLSVCAIKAVIRTCVNLRNIFIKHNKCIIHPITSQQVMGPERGK